MNHVKHDGMPFKKFWFELEASLEPLPPHMSRMMMVYGLAKMRFEEENEFFQFLLNSGDIWTLPFKVQCWCYELIKDGRIKFYSDVSSN